MSVREEEVRQRFENDTASHEIHVMHDDDLYRHLRFRAPDTGTYYYDLITWPGHLATAGDAGSGYVFARIADMFEFFRSDHGDINPHYWSEKLINEDTRKGTEVYMPELLRTRVDEWLRDTVEAHGFNDKQVEELRSELDYHVIAPASDIPEINNTMRLLCEFGARIVDHPHTLVIADAYEWAQSLHGWDYQFLWACWAIVHGIRRYDEAKARKNG